MRKKQKSESEKLLQTYYRLCLTENVSALARTDVFNLLTKEQQKAFIEWDDVQVALSNACNNRKFVDVLIPFGRCSTKLPHTMEEQVTLTDNDLDVLCRLHNELVSKKSSAAARYQFDEHFELMSADKRHVFMQWYTARELLLDQLKDVV